MLPRDQASLLDILEQIRIIETHMIGVGREACLSDSLRCDAVTLRVAIIGEASTRLSEEFRTAHSEVDWRSMRRMRNFLSYVYDQIEHDQVWDTVHADLEPLKTAVEAILAEDTRV